MERAKEADMMTRIFLAVILTLSFAACRPESSTSPEPPRATGRVVIEGGVTQVTP